jgi:hypothetical protein
MVSKNIVINFHSQWYKLSHHQEVYSHKTRLDKRTRLLTALTISETVSFCEEFKVYDLDLLDYRYITIDEDLSDKFKHKYAAEKFRQFLYTNEEVFIFRDVKYLQRGRTVICYTDTLEKARARYALRR